MSSAYEQAQALGLIVMLLGAETDFVRVNKESSVVSNDLWKITGYKIVKNQTFSVSEMVTGLQLSEIREPLVIAEAMVEKLYRTNSLTRKR